jgi:segregation and condensation protein B
MSDPKKNPQKDHEGPSRLPAQEPATNFMSQVEAVLFLSQEPIPARRLAQLADIPEGTRIRALIKNLNEMYDARACAFRVFEVAGGFQLRTRASFVPWLARLHQVPIEIRLSPTALETLAIVAYQQPVLRANIEKIRGVQCGDQLRQLMEQDLVKIVGKSNDLGRPFLYGTTKHFLQVFGLNRVEELSQ